MKRVHCSSGVSLLEMIIYVAILSAVTVLVVGSMLALARSYHSLAISRDINNSATIALDRISREIRSAKSINIAASTLESHPGQLVLNTKDNAGQDTTIDFYLESGVLKVREGGIERGSLTKQKLLVTNLVFRRIASTSIEAVKIELTLEGSSGPRTKQKTFYTSALLRGIE